jgi:hypothetical protein
MSRKTRRRNKPSARRSVIFPDTVVPKNEKEIILSYVTGIMLPKKSIAFYLERAERTLRDAGMKYGQESFARTSEDFKQHRPPSVSRLTENPKLAPAIFKAWSLISLNDSLDSLNELTAKILRETFEAGKPADGFQNLPSLIDRQNELAREIGELGAEIQGHGSERLARIGKAKVKGAKPLIGSRKKTIPAYDSTLRRLRKEHPDWSGRSIVREALKNPPAQLQPGSSFGHGSVGALRRRLALIESQSTVQP